MRVLAPSSDCKLGTHACSTKIECTCAEKKLTSMLTTPTKIPFVTLDTEFVTDSMAARLCTSLVGHILFLKSQIPFPVMQLTRIPGGDATSRAAKKRQELLNSFDTLTSHLITTFTALSTAFALCSSTSRQDAGRAYLAVVLGPTPGSARSRVIVGMDALEARVWGERSNHSDIPSEHAEVQQGTNDDEEKSDSGDESGLDYDSDGITDSDKCGDSDDSGDWDDEKAELEMESDKSFQVPSPPLSRTPSPCSSPLSPSTPLPRSYAQELEYLRAAERLLSRTLASACGEIDGQGMASEMSPTQTHIVLRAPRRFMHPAWVPKQTLSNAFDALLDEFLKASGERPTKDDVKKKRKEVTWKDYGFAARKRATEEIVENGNGEVPEEDEMIWWTWDGKLNGFVDW